MARNRKGAVAASMAAVALLVAACSGNGGSSSTTSDAATTEPDETATEPAETGEEQTITWWHNATGEPLVSFWTTVGEEFAAENPGVTVDVQSFQNEELQRTLIPNALLSGDAPDLFQQWGAGELAAQVAAGHIRDISADVADEVAALGATANPWQLDGKTYGLPYTFGLSGFWYNTELFAEAGITSTPTTLDELYGAIDQLKAASITPIAVGAGSGWPAAHYWYHFALKSCSPEVLQAAQAELVFDDACFVTAGELLGEFIESEPFNEGYLATDAQQGAGSSAGLVATGRAAMELMGHWNPGVMGGILTEEAGEDVSPPEWLGWFNFPGIEGAGGDPNAVLGGGDGFSVHADAPEATVGLLKYILSDDVQARYAEAASSIPTVPGAADAVTDPNLQLVLEGLQNATYVQLWLDTAYGPAVGAGMNDAIVSYFGGSGSPQGIVDAIKTSVENL